MNSLRSRQWYAENFILIIEVPSHYVRVGMWCALSALGIIVHIFLETTNSHRCALHVLTFLITSDITSEFYVMLDPHLDISV